MLGKQFRICYGEGRETVPVSSTKNSKSKWQHLYDAVCFHSQQCVEKLMKALLIHHGIVPPRSHDLVQLDQLLKPVLKEWSWEVQDLQFMTRAAVDFRYPGESADRGEAAEAFEICTRLRSKLLALFSA